MSGKRAWPHTGVRSLVLALGLGAGVAVLAAPATSFAGPPPGMPDPSQMSGIPRPDPSIAPGTVTVRLLDGGFASPAIGVEATLELTGPSGETTTRKAVSAEQGRAKFSGLSEFYGFSVVAQATVAGQQLRSQPFVLTNRAGVALLLVTGAETPPAGPPNAASAAGSDPHGGQGAMPVPGVPFPLAGRPRGTLVVGCLDFDRAGNAAAGQLGALSGIEVTLRATVPGESEPRVLTGQSDVDGRVVFEELDASLPDGAAMVVEAVLAEGEEPTRSQSFSLGDTAYAVILARGVAASSPPPRQQAAQSPVRQPMPGPRADGSLGAGEVRVFVVDGFDQPVVDQAIVIHSSNITGESSDRVGRTDAQGMAIVRGVPYGDENLAQVRVIYDGAPYSSKLFNLPTPEAGDGKADGAVVMLRVFDTTTDRTRVRSAIQVDVAPRENDFAAVTFLYAVFVEGNEAFWVPDGMRIYGPEGTRRFHVLPESVDLLRQDDEGSAPWGTLDRPLEPGVELRLSFTVGIEHDGSLELDWSAPFPLVPDASLVTVPDTLEVTHGVAGAPEINPHGNRDGGPLRLYKLGHQAFEPGVCDGLARAGVSCMIAAWSGSDFSIVVEDLPTRTRLWPRLAWGLVGFTGLAVLASVLLRRRVGRREALLRRRDALVEELVALDARPVKTGQDRRQRTRVLEALDRIYRQLQALE